MKRVVQVDTVQMASVQIASFYSNQDVLFDVFISLLFLAAGAVEFLAPYISWSLRPFKKGQKEPTSQQLMFHRFVGSIFLFLGLWLLFDVIF